MLSTFQMRENEYGPFPYRIMEYDELTQALLPVDLCEKTVSFNIYLRTQQTDGSWLESMYASGSCSLLDGDDGWVQAEFPTMSTGWYRVEFPTEDDTSLRVYPRFDDQLIEVT